MVDKKLSNNVVKSATSIPKVAKEMEEEEFDSGQALHFSEDTEIIEILDDEVNIEEGGEEHVTKKGIVVKEMKNGKTMFIFSGDQKDMASEVTTNIQKKLETSKKNELIDFQVIDRRRKYQQPQSKHFINKKKNVNNIIRKENIIFYI